MKRFLLVVFKTYPSASPVADVREWYESVESAATFGRLAHAPFDYAYVLDGDTGETLWSHPKFEK